MATLEIDEINNIGSIDNFYSKYFGEMELPEHEIEKRIELANRFESIFFFFFSLLLADSTNYEIQEKEHYAHILAEKYINVVSTFYESQVEPGGYIESLANRQSEIIVDETLLKITDDYYLSEERAMNISANETNSVANYYREIDMINAGKTRKRWKTRMDGKERKTHKAARGQEKSIYEPFIIGGEKMMFPHDRSLGASDKECINCRCVVEYF